MKHEFKEIEPKWQKKWEEAHVFHAENDYTKPKYYALVEFPYPSGQGLHVGHPRSYTALDIVARKRRMQGYNVLYPMGWDAFGLPTENFAIKNHIHPAIVTKRNIENFTRQLKMLGYSFDWDRVVDTTDPEYYKWTQWIFLQMYKHGLAYKTTMPVNWCTSCKCVLANEEVVEGVCERCGAPVIRKEKSQWMLRITKYADRLIDLLTAMGRDYYEFVSIAPQEKLMQYFRVSLIAAVIVTIPVALYQVYAFAKPGLKRSESFFFRLVLLFGLALFCVGVLFAYKVTLPFMLNFLVTLEGTDYITASISIESYINLCLTMFIIFGCVFEMPLVTIILSKMGIANPEILKKGRGVAIVLIFFIAAVVTPPDIVSQCMVAIPMVLLYFVSIFLSGIFYKPKEDDDDEDDEDEDEE